MASGPPITDHDREQVRALHAEGKSRNAIAKAIGRAQSTVSKLAAEMGLDFDRSRTAAATKARQVDAKARRAELAEKLLDLAHEEADAFRQPCTLHSFGGRDHTYNSKTVDRPPPRERRDMAATLNILIDRHARLVELDRDDGASEVASLLGSLLGGLQAKHGTGDEPLVGDQ